MRQFISYITAMTLRAILIHPDAKLKKLCPPVVDFDAALRTLADDMLGTMYEAPGVGLAAPQVGVLKRLFVMDCDRDAPGDAPTVVINPEITWASDEMVTNEEGCLSIPDIYDDVTRPSSIRMRWQDIDGKVQERELDELWATCAQHELDHLNGKLFIDYLSGLKRGMITTKMRKLKRELARVS